MEDHVKKVHPIGQPSELESNCCFCDFKAKNKGGLKIHMKAKHAIKCDECDFKTQHETEMNIHIVNVHEDYKVTESFCDEY